MNLRLFATLSVCALAACSGPDDTANTAAPDQDTAPATPATIAATPTPATTDVPLPDTIPSGMQGRWGLVPADCTSTRGDAKGLLVIGPDKMKFYESVGTLKTVKEADENRFLAAFDYTGEGMSWTRDEEMLLQEGGHQLIRTEHGEDAMPQPLRYERCT